VSTSEPAIVFDNVSKWFGPVVAVSDVSFTISSGITALLGPNGAGKSTVMRMLCGLTMPSKGSISVLGHPPRTKPDLYKNIGLVPQQDSVFEPLLPLDFVRSMASLSGVSEADTAARNALLQVELDPTDTRPLRMYSKGMRQRVKVAAALVHEPQIVILDEPLNGLDPRQRLRMIEQFTALGEVGRTVIITSHILEEVERFGSRVLVIAEGRLAAEGDFHAIRALMDDRPHQVRVKAEPARAMAGALIGTPGVVAVRLAEEGLVVDVDDVAAFRRSVLIAAQKSQARVELIEPLDEDLESVFRYLVSRRY
jgi:ABC-2 type transport system ATP-binding protein